MREKNMTQQLYQLLEKISESSMAPEVVRLIESMKTLLNRYEDEYIDSTQAISKRQSLILSS